MEFSHTQSPPVSQCMYLLKTLKNIFTVSLDTVSLHRLKRITFPQTLAERTGDERMLQEAEVVLKCFNHFTEQNKVHWGGFDLKTSKATTFINSSCLVLLLALTA